MPGPTASGGPFKMLLSKMELSGDDLSGGRFLSRGSSNRGTHALWSAPWDKAGFWPRSAEGSRGQQGARPVPSDASGSPSRPPLPAP